METFCSAGEDIDSATDDEEEAAEDKEEVEDNPLLVKEKKEKIDKTNLWFSKVKQMNKQQKLKVFKLFNTISLLMNLYLSIKLAC